MIFTVIRDHLVPEFTVVDMEQDHWDAERFITRYRNVPANLRTQLKHIITRAGLKARPRLWHNLRSTRQTEQSEMECRAPRIPRFFSLLRRANDPGGIRTRVTSVKGRCPRPG